MSRYKEEKDAAIYRYGGKGWKICIELTPGGFLVS
jgi:hypothetical protein